jgi:hypothetical protein
VIRRSCSPVYPCSLAVVRLTKDSPGPTGRMVMVERERPHTIIVPLIANARSDSLEPAISLVMILENNALTAPCEKTHGKDALFDLTNSLNRECDRSAHRRPFSRRQLMSYHRDHTTTPPPGQAMAPEAVLLRLAWETVQATGRPRPARLDPAPVRTRWGRRRRTRRDR